jgi:hypothetical protein
MLLENTMTEPMEGIIEQEPMDTPDMEPTEGQNPTAEPTQEPVAEPDPKPQQSAEDNARFAAARRQAEAQMRGMQDELAMLRQENARYKEQQKTLIQYTNHDSYDALMQDVEQDLRARKYKALTDAGVDPRLVEQLVNEGINHHPDMVSYRAEKEQRKQQEVKVQLEAALADFRKQVEEIGKLDDRIKGPEDLQKMDNFALFDDLVRNQRYRPIDAYRIANFDRLAEKRAAAARQETRNSINSRQHLKPTGGTGADPDVIVPPDVMAMYRTINPGATDAEIRKHWMRGHPKGE